MALEGDGRAVLECLREWSPVSRGIFCRLGLDRALVKKTLAELSASRALQRVFFSISCATRFKFCSEGVQLRTKYGYCGNQSSLQCPLDCTHLRDPETDREEDTISFLADLTRRAYNFDPTFPVPLHASSDSEDEGKTLKNWAGRTIREFRLVSDPG